VRSTPTLDEALASTASKRAYVRRLFAVIATRYDLITRLLSFGLDQQWKRRLVAYAPISGETRVLDLACGTGDLARRSAARGARVTGLDVTPTMIALARRRPSERAIAWLAADMSALPLRDASFEVMTVGYGLRNVADLEVALAEIYRVLTEGGCLCSLDFDRPESPVVRHAYLGYLGAVGSVLGFVLHRDPDTYRYIAASVRRYPGARAVAERLRRVGFRDVRHVPVLGGLMAIHVARK
jgi:demethylmenaquinone methyltransferase/2-methoxy-6-polyprenyl-1,4-benzoquinol methylase